MPPAAPINIHGSVYKPSAASLPKSCGARERGGVSQRNCNKSDPPPPLPSSPRPPATRAAQSVASLASDPARGATLPRRRPAWLIMGRRPLRTWGCGLFGHGAGSSSNLASARHLFEHGVEAARLDDVEVGQQALVRHQPRQEARHVSLEHGRHQVAAAARRRGVTWADSFRRKRNAVAARVCHSQRLGAPACSVSDPGAAGDTET